MAQVPDIIKIKRLLNLEFVQERVVSPHAAVPVGGREHRVAEALRLDVGVRGRDLKLMI